MPVESTGASHGAAFSSVSSAHAPEVETTTNRATDIRIAFAERRSRFRPLNLTHRLIARELGGRLEPSHIHVWRRSRQERSYLRHRDARARINEMPIATQEQRHAKVRAMCGAGAGLLPDCNIDRILESKKKTRILCDADMLNAIAMMYDDERKIDMQPFECMDNEHVPFHDGRIDFDHLFGAVFRAPDGERPPPMPAALTALRHILKSGLFNAYVHPVMWRSPITRYLTAPNAQQLAMACDCPPLDLLNNTPQTLLADIENGKIVMGPISAPLFASALRFRQTDLLDALLASPAGRAFDAIEPLGWRPINLALMKGEIDIAERLLKHACTIKGGELSDPRRQQELRGIAEKAPNSEALLKLLKNHLLTH